MPSSQNSQAKGLQGARFSPPKAPLLAVDRVRLLARIAESDAPLKLICAPAGFGKTTLMQQVRKQLQVRAVATVWLKVEHDDNDLGRFLRSLMAAIQGELPQSAAGRASADGSTQGLATELLDLISLSEIPVTLFLDDLELVVDRDVLDFLQRLLRNLGPNHQLFVACRSSPALALGRMRAHGLVLELDQSDLRFTPEETRCYLDRHGLGAPELKALQRSTEGWPVALQLAAVALKTKATHGADWMRLFSGATDNVAEYLAQEVLDSRPLQQRDFLLRSAALGEFCAEMCDAALERNDSAEMIADILLGNLLLSPIGPEQRWCRYHPLFADFLRARMQRDSRHELHGLHRRAALWCSNHGLVSEAVTHAFAAEDHKLAADLLASSAMEMVRSGRVAEAARAIGMLPDAEVRGRPSLVRAAAFAAIFAHRYNGARRYMEIIEQSDPAAAEDDDELAAMRLMLLGWTDRAPELFETIQAMRAGTPRFGAFTTGLACNASAYCNIALGRWVEAERDLAKSREACEAIGALYALNYSACFAAAIEFNFGDLATARTTLEGAMNRAIAEGQRYGGAGAVVATYLAELLYEANDLDACEALVDDYLPIVVETGLPDHLIMLHRITARLHFLRGRRDAGQGILVQLSEIGARRGIRRLSAAAWLERSYAALRSGDLEGARRALATGGDEALWGGFGEFHLHAGEIEDPLIAELRLRLVLGQCDQALPRVESALRSAEAAGRRRRALRLLFLQAQMLQATGRRSAASAAFDSAVLRAAGNGMARVLADDAWATESLVSSADVVAEPRAVTLLRELTARGAPPDLKGPRETSGEGAAVALRLTSRETQILRLVWKGHSNKEIARDLFLTENTIETHLRRIYEKLGTRKRTQAAALAREAGAI